MDSGLAASLARPGSNMTGVSILATEIDAKKIEVMKEFLPDIKRFGVFNDPASSGRERPQKIADIARRLAIVLQTIDIHGPDDLEPAFQALQTGRVEGVNVVSSAMLNGLRRRLGELSLAAKIPAICQFRNMVEAGCLASYGITIPGPLRPLSRPDREAAEGGEACRLTRDPTGQVPTGHQREDGEGHGDYRFSDNAIPRR